MSATETVEAEPVENLWSSILDSVSSTRSIPSKQVLILGEKNSGRSTISAGILGKKIDPSKPDKTGFALGYDWADIRDDADEDTIARLSVYTVPSSSRSYMSLLPHFLPARTSLPHTLVMIVLDWTRPWSFIEQLEMWLSWIETWSKGDGNRETEIVREECRERLQSQLQHYTEPSSSETPLPGTTSLSSTLLPLGPGTLTHNTGGVPVIVVCSKADLIDEGHDIVGGTGGISGMVKGKGGEWEERTDGIMQVLRTICLKYGAALFYTTSQPSTLSALRQYVLHFLFVPPAPSPGLSGDASAPLRNPFKFSERPNTLDRDRVIVPAGWDSWGKIAVLRDGFDAKTWGEGWERDLDPHNTEGGIGAKEMFTVLVGGDQGAKPTPLPPFILPTPEQQFLALHYEANAKSSDRDPRQTFRTPTDPSNLTAAGVVGPLGSSSFSLPTVERALVEMEGGSANERDSKRTGPIRRDTSGRPAHQTSALPASGSSSALGHARPPTSPASPSSGMQHDVLQNFFQSLLSSRDRSNAGAGAGSGSNPGSQSQSQQSQSQNQSQS